MAESSALASAFSSFSTAHEAVESGTCLQKGVESHFPAFAGGRDACEGVVDDRILWSIGGSLSAFAATEEETTLTLCRRVYVTVLIEASGEYLP